MISSLLFLHLLFAAVWLGCVVTEALFERALLAGDRSSHVVLADLHVRVDKVVEVPAIFIVFLTGVGLWFYLQPTGAAFYMMLVSGVVAIAANVYCVLLVFKRRDAAHALQWNEFDRLDHLQHKVGAIVLLGLLIAIAAGACARA